VSAAEGSAPRRAAGEGARPARGRLPRLRSGPPVTPGPAAAALIVAHDQARRIAATVRAALAIPGVDLVLVVDDGSTDNTQDLARRAGAVVVRHSHVRGRSAAVETGASVIAMRDEPGAPPRAVLLLDPNLGHYAIGAAPLVPAVLEGVCDLAIALTDAQAVAPGVPSGIARTAVERATGWSPRQPLSRIRCLTREALEASLPLARGSGLEPGMTRRRARGGTRDHGGRVATSGTRARRSTTALPSGRANRYREVLTAVSARRVRATIDSTRAAIVHRRPEAASDPREDA